MLPKPADRFIAASLILALAATALWGYIGGDFATLFRPHGAERAAAEQRALGHLFGSDQPFSPSADDVTAQAQSDGDTITWKMLAQAKLNPGAEGKPGVTFSPELLALDNREVTLTGYIFPLQASGGQYHFLLSATPPSCPYCLPGGPAELVDATVGKPLPFTYDPVTIHGTLHLLKDGASQDGMFYRLVQAER